MPQYGGVAIFIQVFILMLQIYVRLRSAMMMLYDGRMLLNIA